MAEYLIRRVAPGRFQSFSAGSKPLGTVNPFAKKVLQDLYKIDASDARSKSMDELKTTEFDFVVTVCDNAKESCPAWPGQPLMAHWSSDDPAGVEGTDEEKTRAFRNVASQINRRIELFTSLPLEKMERMKLQAAMSDIGKK